MKPYSASRMRYLRVIYRLSDVRAALKELDEETQESEYLADINQEVKDALEDVQECWQALETIKGFKCSRVKWTQFLKQEQKGGGKNDNA